MTDLQSAAEDVTAGLERLAHATPHPGAAFSALIASLNTQGLTAPTARALAGAALSIAMRCETCARRHAHEAARAGVDRAAFKLALQRGVLMAHGPAAIHAAQALVDFDTASPPRPKTALAAPLRRTVAKPPPLRAERSRKQAKKQAPLAAQATAKRPVSERDARV